MLGLRTAIHPVDDLAAARDWYAKLLEITPYFDQPFYVGFDVGGYELGLVPVEDDRTASPYGVEALWGVADLDAAYWPRRGPRRHPHRGPPSGRRRHPRVRHRPRRQPPPGSSSTRTSPSPPGAR
ncbi:MAG: hypothetical protein R3F43_14485 [bacterium]